MELCLTDRATIAGVRETRDGYLVAEARIARTGVQNYTASELGLKDRKPGDVIRVYRPEEEVFAADAMAGLAHRPITIDHPSEMVTADNWRKHAVGSVGGEVARDGEYVKVPLVVMDAAAIRAVKTGKRELSVGYRCQLDMTPGETPTGEAYDAVQRGIVGNHLAICDVARGGPQLRIGDQEKPMTTKTIMFDGVPVDVTDAAEAIIKKLEARAVDAETKVGTLTVEVSTRDGKIAALEKQVADANDPAALTAKVQARAALVADAKAKAPTVAIADNASDAAIRRAVVEAVLGDAGKALDDAAIGGAFVALPKAGGTDPLARAIGDNAGKPALGDAKAKAEAAFNARIAAMKDAYKTQAAA